MKFSSIVHATVGLAAAVLLTVPATTARSQIAITAEEVAGPTTSVKYTVAGSLDTSQLDPTPGAQLPSDFLLADLDFGDFTAIGGSAGSIVTLDTFDLLDTAGDPFPFDNEPFLGSGFFEFDGDGVVTGPASVFAFGFSYSVDSALAVGFAQGTSSVDLMFELPDTTLDDLNLAVGDGFVVATAGGDITFAVIPEPTTVALLAVAGAGLIARRRCRH
ncbi:MAG: PEP-CTERM sorting domain-containing protein [Planctomycetota bacterium]